MRMTRLLLLLSVLAFAWSTVDAQGNFNTSLHKTRAGKTYWYGAANGGFEAMTNVPIDSLGCMQCHGPKDADGNTYPTPYVPGCTDCHKTGVFSKDSLKVDQCLGCHSRQKTESTTLGYPDVHRDRGMKCWDCHTSNDVHGPDTVLNSMLEPGGIEVDCEDCHKTSGGTAPLPNHSAYDPSSHGGKIHCTACHAKTVTSCYSCHLESQIKGMKRAKQVLHNFVMLGNRAKDNKVYPMTFQSLTYQGMAFTAFGPFTSHTINDSGRTCAECHANFGGSIPAIAEYNSTGEIYFAKWRTSDSTLEVKTGVVPIPADFQRSLKMDFLTYNGSPSDPVVPSKNWSYIGKNSPDGHQMFFATPLTKVQMAKLGFDTLKTTSVENVGGEVPGTYRLNQNYPNPFNPSTKIEFGLPRATEVRLAVYTVLGAEVKTLIAGQKMAAGNHAITFSAAGLPSGIYMYKITTPDFSQTRKMVLLK
jgi:hypothetical protein